MKNKKHHQKTYQLFFQTTYLGLLFILVFIAIIKFDFAEAATPICTSSSEICTFLTEKYAQGLAAGNAGDYYHNADDTHTLLSGAATDHPQVTIMTPTRGFVSSVEQEKVIVGNASLAYTSLPGTVSLARYRAMDAQYSANSVYQQYINNNAFWYPEHLDHDETDDYHCMLPSVGTSQGSSGSEIDEVKKFFWTLAAFHPETKTKLREKGLLMPTIQMIMRLTRVAGNAEYLSGKAHPNAFDNYAQALAMVQMANAMLPTEVPPMIQLEMTADAYSGEAGRDYFDYNNNQRLYDTPVSIARLWKNFGYIQKIRVSAKKSFDANEKSLTYHWVVLRGNSEHVRLTPLNGENSEVEIEINHHPKTTIPDSTRNTNLVVIGAFVHNGVYYSAPGFVTSYTLPNEERNYDPNTRQLLDISYHIENIMEKIICNKAWTRDVFQYNGEGFLQGWTRYNGTSASEFTRQGYLVLAKNGEGQVIQAQQVQYSREYTSVPDRIIWGTSGDPFVYDHEAPSAPTQVLLFNPTESSLEISWLAANDNVGVIGYQLDVSSDNAFLNMVPGYHNKNLGKVTTTLISGLSPATIYYARLRAYDEMENFSEYSAVVSGQTPGQITPLPNITPTLAITPAQNITPTLNITSTATISIPLNLDKVRVYPQPWRPDHYGNLPITFDRLTPGSTIKIFTIAGDLVKIIKSEGESVYWDIANNAGSQVSQGIYIYLITNDKGQQRRGKLAIIR
ncbi:fibronectin type III domain-containing protein [bacterium]|nr:fibronectin type III domain-containing protein [bacterium]